MIVSDLLTHASGLTYHFLSDSKVSDMYADAKILKPSVPLGEAVDDLARYPLAFQPGSRWQYSLGIDVAARVIEVISGQALGDFLKERLFVPLGMVDTAFEVPVDRRNRLAAMYGRPDIFVPTSKLLEALALWQQGFNERIDVPQPIRSTRRRASSAAGTGSSAPRAIISASRRCWRTGENSTACAVSAARRWSSCIRTTCRRRCCRWS